MLKRQLWCFHQLKRRSDVGKKVAKLSNHHSSMRTGIGALD